MTVPTPIFVITRDRVTYTRRLVVEHLHRDDLEVHIVDHGSTYEPMLEWLDLYERVGPGRIWRFTDVHPRDLWKWGGLRDLTGNGTVPYLVTDCDVVPDRMCPPDWPDRLRGVLEAHREAFKVGLGLRIDDLPDSYRYREEVARWESRYWEHRVKFSYNSGYRGHEVYAADVDTTLALYRPLTEWPEGRWTTGSSLRLGFPYVARHLPWYEPEASALDHNDWIAPAGHKLNDEITYYREHALPGVSHWNDPIEYERG